MLYLVNKEKRKKISQVIKLNNEILTNIYTTASNAKKKARSQLEFYYQ